MKNTNPRYLALLFLLNAINSNADQVIYFDKPPSSSEITRILFPKADGNDAIGVYSGTRGVALTHGMQSMKSSNLDEATFNNKAERKGIGFPIAFDYNSSAIKSEGRFFLNELGVSLSMTKNSMLIIEGHTDAFGPERYNFSLSERRAISVKNYLVRNYNISPQRLKTTGLGESEPLKGMDPFDERNRRVEFFSIHRK